MSKYDDAMLKLEEQFGEKDMLISLSTIAPEPGPDGKVRPAARIVDAYYEDGAFYAVTNAQSGKMKQAAANPNVAVCIVVESFTADAIAENLGWTREEKNKAITEKMHRIFAEWYHVANNDDNPDTCILRVKLTHGLWNDAHKGLQTRIDFNNKTVSGNGAE